ncbi:toxin Bro [Pseudoflavonifractor sp. 524-17]|uniref:BRO-N domain-containing protein n=1 Tax=Pseudoflavonifractor sp. 524-17 TaxID=2304577 RepID=UPI001379CFC9|nr:BRO family protein [Pseudoflavonifractor sp. 524-17]NCE63710.1 toxin Bro [Pseudoflavonifractor sp. 524-17]
MNKLQIFNNPEFGTVRTVEIDGEPWLVGKDVASALGYADTKSALSDHVDAEDKRIIQRGQIATLDIPNRGLTIINESGLYSLVLSSKLPGAKKFRRWVTAEVLPSIRKDGRYQIRPMTSYQQQNICIQKAKLLNQIASEYDGTYKQVLQAYATKELTGEFLLPLPALERKTYSAAEIGVALGISAHKVGTMTNSNGLKTDKYGKWFVDKSAHSSKEVQSFRYYESIIPILRELL